MNTSGNSAPLCGDRGAVAKLNADLNASDFFVSEVEELLGPTASAALRREQLLPARVGVEPRLENPQAALTALFVLGMEVSNAQLARALPTLGVDGAAHLGLIEQQGRGENDAVRALIDLRPYAASDSLGEINWWIASDLSEEVLERALPVDHVLGVGGAGKTLAGITVRDARKRALDLGTGSGIQALHLTRHCKKVVATDISTRALDFARFNLDLNGIDSKQVELRSGSMLEPVAEEKFDLIVSNPPFVITPPTTGLPEYEYRTAPRSRPQHGDGIVEHLVTHAGSYLNAGGMAQFLGNWEHGEAEDWQERITDWIQAAAEHGTPVDAWIVEREVQDPAQYVETWLQDGGANPVRDRQAYYRAYEAWLKDFEARSVEGIGFGYILLRRSANTSREGQLRRIEHVGSAVSGPLGGHIARVLSHVDALEMLSDTQLLSTHFVCPADITEERYGHPGAGDPALIFLRQGGGYGRSAQVSTWQSAFVGACDGELSAGQICGALAHLGEVEVAQVLADVLPFIRLAIWGGFLEVAPNSGEIAGGQ